MNTNGKHHRALVQNIAYKAMIERGLLPDFSAEALAELGRLQTSKTIKDGPVEGALGIRDMRSLLWASIDNDDSRDLDQLTVAETMPGGKVRIMIAIADVDGFEGLDVGQRIRVQTMESDCEAS